MLSKGDLVKLRLTLDGNAEGNKDIFILGRMMNYCDEEDIFILEPQAISVRKEQVREAIRLREDFDFGNISEELSNTEEGLKRAIPPEIMNIRISNGR